MAVSLISEYDISASVVSRRRAESWERWSCLCSDPGTRTRRLRKCRVSRVWLLVEGKLRGVSIAIVELEMVSGMWYCDGARGGEIEEITW